MGNGTIQGYRGYTIWTKLHRDKWYVFFRCAHSAVNERVTQTFQDEQFGIRVAQIIIDNRLGLPASAA